MGSAFGTPGRTFHLRDWDTWLVWNAFYRACLQLAVISLEPGIGVRTSCSVPDCTMAADNAIDVADVLFCGPSRTRHFRLHALSILFKMTYYITTISIRQGAAGSGVQQLPSFPGLCVLLTKG